MRRLLALAVVPWAVAATPATAATVDFSAGGATGKNLTYTAAPGETNTVSIAVVRGGQPAMATITIKDPGATITATGCESKDAHTVVCTDPSGANRATVDLGDGNDKLTVTGSLTTNFAAQGGEGNDTITAASPSKLDGGPGTDTVTGSPFDDVIVDADTEADKLDGGADSAGDQLSYAGRTDGVTVDLGTNTVSTGDTVSNFEGVIGGDGDDTITGRTASDRFEGGAGNDVITGLDGNDRLAGGPGQDTLKGDAGDDELVPGADADILDCGDGKDEATNPEAGELLAPTCEQVTFEFSPNGGHLDFPLAVTAKRKTVRFKLGCPAFEDDDGVTRACDLSLKLREAGGKRRLLGKGRITGEASGGDSGQVVKLNKLGRKKVKKGVKVTATIAGIGGGLSWTFRIKH